MTESNIVNACLDVLRAYKIFGYRQNTGAFKNERGDFYRYGVPGGTDIVVVIKGMYIGIEVKKPGGKQSARQKEFMVELQTAGGRYWIIHSVDELITELKIYARTV